MEKEDADAETGENQTRVDGAVDEQTLSPRGEAILLKSEYCYHTGAARTESKRHVAPRARLIDRSRRTISRV